MISRNILETAEQRIFHIAQQSDQSQLESLHDLIKQTMEMLQANEGKHLTGLSTGFSELDEMTSGCRRAR
jgi:replicative DNA helicase